MARFVYVEARSIPVPAGEGVLVSFDSVIVAAADEDSAYRVGRHALQVYQQQRGDPYNHLTGSFLNDYVVLVPDV